MLLLRFLGMNWLNVESFQILNSALSISQQMKEAFPLDNSAGGPPKLSFLLISNQMAIDSHALYSQSISLVLSTFKWDEEND